MLAAIENRLAALIGNGLASRTHTHVVRTAGPNPDPGKGRVLVTLSGVDEDPSFPVDLFSLGQGTPLKAPVQRVVKVRLHAQVDVTVTPVTAADSDAQAARDLALDDCATIIYVLHQEDVYSGKAFVTADADPGYTVHSFVFEKVTMNGAAAASVLFSGTSDIWPAGSTADGGMIAALDRILVPLPIKIAVDQAALVAGGATPVRVPSFAPTRLAAGARTPASLAVSVMSDAPPAQRGTVPEGTAGPETGLRILPVASPATVFSYHAPAANPGPARWEYIQVHLATADLQRGTLLGTAAVRIAGGA